MRELALRYVGKYATTRAKLRDYLTRKIRERGWTDGGEPDLDALAARFAELGLVDDAAFALAKSRSLSARGYGKRRLIEQLRLAGIADDDSFEAVGAADSETVKAALRLARRRRIGPFADEPADRPQREKWIAAMVRAGHGFTLANVIARLEPGQEIDLDHLRERFQRFST